MPHRRKPPAPTAHRHAKSTAEQHFIEPVQPTPALEEDALDFAKAVLARADTFSHNQEISSVELNATLLGHPLFHEFAVWMGTDERHSEFKHSDTDSSGNIGIPELYTAVRRFMGLPPIDETELARVVEQFPHLDPAAESLAAAVAVEERQRLVAECPYSPTELATVVVRNADKMGRNAKVSALEMGTFLKNHSEPLMRHFYQFAMNGQTIQRGIVPEFKKVDRDHSGDLGLSELQEIASKFLNKPLTEEERSSNSDLMRELSRYPVKKVKPGMSLLELATHTKVVPPQVRKGKLRARQLAAKILKGADRFNANGLVSRVELDTFLKDHSDPILADFYNFCTVGISLAGGLATTNKFKMFDDDHSGDLGLAELEQLAKEFLNEADSEPLQPNAQAQAWDKSMEGVAHFPLPAQVQAAKAELATRMTPYVRRPRTKYAMPNRARDGVDSRVTRYRLSAQEQGTYDSFVQVLASLDRSLMLEFVEDALKDAQDQRLLQKFN